MSRADSYEHLKKLLQVFSDRYPDTLYHYTNADGISGIIDNHEVWMSNTAFMNDPTELKALENAKDIGPSDFTRGAVGEEWPRMKERGWPNYYYMASFSKKRDSLAQWRAYGKFCIRFDAGKLAVIRRQISLYECLYTKDAIREWILAKEKIPEWDNLPDEELQRSSAAYNLLYLARMKYKNEDFSAEEEIRLVTTSRHYWPYSDTPEEYEDDLPIHFRPHRLCGFVPYLKLIDPKGDDHPLGTKETETKETEMRMKERKLNCEAAPAQRKLLPITEVIVGPMAYQEEAKTACKILLSERGYKEVPVTVSNISYREI